MSARHLLNNAQNGNFEAAVQVFLNYRDGTQDFDKSEEQAQIAFENAIRILESNFFLSEINIYNFRKIINLKINLHKNLTVFIGENGAGKTSLLRAIQKNLSYFPAFILKENTNGERIVDSDINNVAKKTGEVACLNCSFRMGADYRIDGQLIREPKGITTDLRTEVMKYRKFGQNIRELIAYKKVNLPLFMFYDIDRFKSNENKKNLSNQENVFYQLDGYERSSKSKVTFENLIDWLVKLLKISNANVDSPEKTKIISQIDSLLEAGADNINNPLNELYEDLLSILRLYPEDEIKNKSKRIIDTLETIFRNIYSDLVQIQLINDDDGEDKVALHLKDEIIFLHQFSDGQRVLFGLVGDIARRLILLNPISSNPLNGNGIVLIDEIELHLHPSWQQKVILTLMESFPNVQFILATHSPHVLSTVDKNQIRVIKNNEIVSVSLQTKGVASSDILEQIMETYSIPRTVTEAQWVEDYLETVRKDQYESIEAVDLYNRIVKHFGEEHPVISDIRNQIKIISIRKKMNQRG